VDSCHDTFKEGHDAKGNDHSAHLPARSRSRAPQGVAPGDYVYSTRQTSSAWRDALSRYRRLRTSWGDSHSANLLRLNVYRQSAQTGLAACEWERGTLESLLVTLVTLGELLVGKTLPYFALGMGAMGVSVTIAIW
jgi:hypothetical protein